MIQTIAANWSAPKNIRALSTTRDGGVSQGHYAGLNLGDHVNDDSDAVITNRQMLRQELTLPNDPSWLNQTHSTNCVILDHPNASRDADAAITHDPQQVLAILTADCLPIVLCNRQGTEIAAIHAGWRGLANGIIEATLEDMQSAPKDCLAWIGPAICGPCYATGAEVLDQFTAQYSFAIQAFQCIEQQWYADLPKLADLILTTSGITAVYSSNVCTLENTHLYSYRRAAQTGRIATLIWFQNT